MAPPHLQEIRRVAPQADGSTRFEFVATITEAGTLPTKNLFVMQILDPLDPKNDILARVATPRDLRQIEGSYYLRAAAATALMISGDLFLRVANTTELMVLPQDRTTAVRHGQALYLINTLTRSYPELASADAAVRQLRERLSQLTVAWATINTDFITNPTAEYDLPILDGSVEALRIATYNSAVEARRAAQTALDAAQETYDACIRDCGADRVIHGMLVSDVSFLESARNRVGALASSDAKDFVMQTGAFASDTESYQALLVAKRTTLDTYAERVQACATRCAELRVVRDDLAATRDRTLENERSALADVRAVCPTFTPSE